MGDGLFHGYGAAHRENREGSDFKPYADRRQNHDHGRLRRGTHGSWSKQLTAAQGHYPQKDQRYFDRERCYAPPKRVEKTRIELCKTLLPVPESPMSPPEYEKGPSNDTPLVQSFTSGFHASYHVQNTQPYEDISRVRYTRCLVCGRSVDDIKDEKVNWYMERSTPRDEPEHITRLRREAYINGLNAGSLLFVAPAVSQAAACDGTKITTTSADQETAPGTLPIF